MDSQRAFCRDLFTKVAMVVVMGRDIILATILQVWLSSWLDLVVGLENYVKTWHVEGLQWYRGS